MDDALAFALTLVTALGCALIGGVFFAFSAFIMRALGRLSPECGIAAMQSINVVAVTPLFMTALFGTAAGCLGLVLTAVARWPRADAGYLLAGGLVYLVGCIAVTVLFNVPRNDALARVAAASTADAGEWRVYLKTWTRWNHVRSVSGALAATFLILALAAGE